MRILGIDPGLERIGFSIVEYSRGLYTVVDFGCLKTLKHDTTSARLESVFEQVSNLLKTHNPDVVSCEQLFFFKNNKTIIMVSEARGVILLAASLRGVPIVEPTPLQVKTSLTGWGHAPKQQVQSMVSRIFKLSTIPTSDDAADALAIAYCGAALYTHPRTQRRIVV